MLVGQDALLQRKFPAHTMTLDINGTKLFGTDGVRGQFGREPITPQTVLKLGWCIGNVFRERFGSSSEFFIGKDTRISGYVLESALSSGLLSAGSDICFLGPVPTPAVSHFCRSANAIGIVISASHNRFTDNGIKLFSSDGGKLPSDVEQRIEEMMQRPIDSVDSKSLGKARRIDDVVEQYSEFLCSQANCDLSGLKVVVDSANGASYRIAPNVLKQLNAEVISVADSPNGSNINQDCGSTHPDYIQTMTLKHRADVGIALDGDGDRVLMTDELGNLINGDQILFVIAMARKRSQQLEGGVVGTQMSNIGLEHALAANGIPFDRAEDVGDRYIAKRMLERHWKLGGEENGHILNGDLGLAGDGLVAAIEVLTELSQCKRTLSSLVEGVNLVPQVLVNVHLENRFTPIHQLDLAEWPQVSKAIRAAGVQLNNKGRILLRASGTEPVLRILVEGPDKSQISQVADQLARVVREESNQVAI